MSLNKIITYIFSGEIIELSKLYFSSKLTITFDRGIVKVEVRMIRGSPRDIIDT
jgi:hypothetical protein